MKRLFILFALAAWICAGMAALCTAYSSEKTKMPDSASSDTKAESSESEIQPTASPAETQYTADAGEEENSTIEEPDLRGTIQEVQGTGFTIMPTAVTTSGSNAAAGASEADSLCVDIAEATIETVKIHEGGNEPPQPADARALQAGKSVYLYGSRCEETFMAERVLILEVGDDAE